MSSDSKPETWLFADLRGKRELEEEAPKRLNPEDRRSWVDQQYEQALQSKYDAITQRLKPGVSLVPGFRDGELSMSIDGVTIIDRIFLDDPEGIFILAQWKLTAQSFPITDNTTGKRLCAGLRKLAVTNDVVIRNQIIALEKELGDLEADVAQLEAGINKTVYALYGLTGAEIRLVERG